MFEHETDQRGSQNRTERGGAGFDRKVHKGTAIAGKIGRARQQQQQWRALTAPQEATAHATSHVFIVAMQELFHGDNRIAVIVRDRQKQHHINNFDA